MTKFDDLHQKWMKNPAYAAEYAASASEFELGETLVNAEATGNELVIEFRPRRGDAGGGDTERMGETPT
jgi:hypothetical protein